MQQWSQQPEYWQQQPENWQQYGTQGGKPQHPQYGMQGGKPQNPYMQKGGKGPPFEQQPLVKIFDPMEDLRNKRKQRRRERRERDKENGIWSLMILGTVCAFMWGIPIVGGSWHSKEFNGIGASYFEVHTGLLSINVEISCGKNILEDQLCNLMGKLKGRHSLRSATDLTCAVGQGTSLTGNSEACYMMRQLYYASIPPIICFLLALIMYGMAVGFIYYYWFIEPLKRTRNLAHIWFVLGLVFGIIGFGLWTLVSPDIAQFPKAMVGTALRIPAVGGDIFGNSIDNLPYGWTWFWCIFSLGFSVATVLVWKVFFHPHPEERDEDVETAQWSFNMMYGEDNSRTSTSARNRGTRPRGDSTVADAY